MLITTFSKYLLQNRQFDDFKDILDYKVNNENLELVEDQILTFLKTLPVSSTQDKEFDSFFKYISKNSRFSNRMKYIVMEYTIKQLKDNLNIKNEREMDLDNNMNLVENYSNLMKLKKETLLSRNYRFGFLKARVSMGLQFLEYLEAESDKYVISDIAGSKVYSFLYLGF